MTQEEIKRICNSHGVDPEGAELFNDEYIISRTGDVIGGVNFSYGIFDFQLLKPDWVPHLRQKNWYDDKTFVPVYIEALRRKGVDSFCMNITYDRSVVICPSSIDVQQFTELLSVVTELEVTHKKGKIAQFVKNLK